MFVWDESNIKHLARHGILPKEAEQVIESDPFEIERQIRGGESRFLYLGETVEGRVLFVVITQCSEGLRVVTAFPADRRSRKFYASQRFASNVKDTEDT